MIFHHGIFASLDKFKILVPLSAIKDYEFDSINSILKKNKKTLQPDDIINVKISEFRYEKQKLQLYWSFNLDFKEKSF